MDEAASLLIGLHGRLLRLLCEHERRHYNGLGAAGRCLFRRGVIDGKLKNKLLNLDTATAFVRHVTAPLCDDLHEQVRMQLSEYRDAQTPTPSADENNHSEAEPQVEFPLPVEVALPAEDVDGHLSHGPDVGGSGGQAHHLQDAAISMPKVLPPDMLDNLYFKFKKADDVRNITDVVDKIASHHADFIVKELSETPVAEAMSFDAAQLLLGGVLRKQVFALVPAFAVGLPDALQVHVDAALDRHVLDMTIRVLICKGWPCD
eukprot:TRINITY_DN7013_c0_g1_i2.p1 TRINITY_DN7013_c0_g1~~TRINITY_DN7013_c0_g1_i2.p1  ORF type:complete len:261 (-),score=45.97 TRINITY_DN7013_c0_g1_i2:74-856(-)